MIGIYMIYVHGENDHCYIGQSVNIKKRWRQHKYQLKAGIHENKYLQNCYNKYGKDAFEYIILCECEEEKLNELEQYYILEFDSYAYSFPGYGMNLVRGGDANRGIVYTEARKENLSKQMVERWKDDEYRNKIRSSLKEALNQESYIENARKRTLKQFEDKEFYDKYIEYRRSDEFREKERISHLGFKVSEETKEKLRHANCKPVICIETGEVFYSAKEAERAMKERYSKTLNIKAVCNGIRNTAGGFHWKYFTQA